MEKEELFSLPAYALAEAVQNQKVTAEEALDAVFQRIEERESDLHAYISTRKEAAQIEARNLKMQGKLSGVPVAIKDNLMLSGEKTTCGSKMLQEYVAPYTATCVRKLQDSGCVIVGKTNMDEFGMGVSTETSFFGATSHPKAPSFVPGGSSGGAAAAVASGEAWAAVGTDTGGSIRQPAAFCGLVGLRPTYGTISRHGLVAFASSMDIAGPITRSVKDSALFFNVMHGQDPKDQTSVPSDDVSLDQIEQYSVKGKRIGVLRELLESKDVDEEVSQAVRGVMDFYERSGAVVEMVDMSLLDHAVAIYYVLSSAEASSNLARYDGVRYGFRAEGCRNPDELYTKTRSEGFGLEVKRRILLGNYVLSSEHFEDCFRQAERAREMMRREFSHAFSKYDLLLSPVSATTAPHKGKAAADPLASYLSDLCTVPASLAGIPAISVPCGQSRSGMPIGVQLMADRFGEQEILGAARVLEREYYSETDIAGKGASSDGGI
ncbi:MAG: Asp-tRNA(Asn)/Glu-tRNA(Gln) amidotransferase subunit GatA [Clostridiales bacterium]|nr:Asp-tRNA(Asn)/Glu-tRNA(Gln) amidotransferase subunit GatA [Clostridiales bacterium]